LSIAMWLMPNILSAAYCFTSTFTHIIQNKLIIFFVGKVERFFQGQKCWSLSVMVVL
jgi:hypothetical protein